MFLMENILAYLGKRLTKLLQPKHVKCIKLNNFTIRTLNGLSSLLVKTNSLKCLIVYQARCGNWSYHPHIFIYYLFTSLFNYLFTIFNYLFTIFTVISGQSLLSSSINSGVVAGA